MENEEKAKYDFDLSTEEGVKVAKKTINDSLENFDEEGKEFLGKLLFLLLDTVTDQQMQIDRIMGGIKRLANNGYLHKHTYTRKDDNDVQ